MFQLSSSIPKRREICFPNIQLTSSFGSNTHTSQDLRNRFSSSFSLHDRCIFMTSPPVRAYHPRPSRSPDRWRNLARILFRPSVRLKTTLYSLSLLIIFIIILAFNVAHTTATAPTQTEYVLNTAPTHQSPADSGEGKNVAEGKDAHLFEEVIQRSFAEPSFELLSGIQPSHIGCNVPLDGLDSERGVLVFLGIFSGVHNRDRRNLYAFIKTRRTS